MKVIIIGLLVVIIYSLGSAVVSLVREGDPSSRKTFHSLVFRIALSIILFLLIIISTSMGWITPNHPGF